jgi:hypothetical protein
MIKMYKEKIVDALTGKETFRDYTEAEILEVQEKIEARNTTEKKEAAAQAQKAADKSALLAKLGITEDEARLLLS